MRAGHRLCAKVSARVCVEREFGVRVARNYSWHCPSMHRGINGGAQGGTGIGPQLSQNLCAMFVRLASNESTTPYQTAAYEQPDSHELTGAIDTHSLALAQP
jgi:hypothetical protein